MADTKRSPGPNFPLPVPRQFTEEDEEAFFPHIKDVRKRLFLKALSSTPFVVLAEQMCGVPRVTHYRWNNPNSRFYDPDYAACVPIAHEMGVDACESELGRRAFHGTDKPISYKGQITDHYKEYSDLLAIAYMNAHRPQRYHRSAESPERDVKYTINIVNYSTQRQTIVDGINQPKDQIEKDESVKSPIEVKIKPW